MPNINNSPIVKKLLCLCLLAHSLLVSFTAFAEDGYDLWLRYPALEQRHINALSSQLNTIVVPSRTSATLNLAQQELQHGLQKLLTSNIAITTSSKAGSIVLARADDFEYLDRLSLPYADLGQEGFIIRQALVNGDSITLLTANTDVALLYATFEFLRHLQIEKSVAELNILSAPAYDLRLLNHWDNLDRSVERGYAGQSIWDWWRLPNYRSSRYTDYARANASLGINGTVVNNVNSNALILTPRYLEKVAALADVLRPWGIKTYLSARFSAPQELGGLATSDPLNSEVQRWWQQKIEEIYAKIPDFGGFLVKANSEGQPGPQDFGRTHADGANMLASALEPFDGIVMWRAFVYSDINPEDRAKQAYSEFKPLDGEFADNVIVQVKNGAIDFQPREPFHPMFGAFEHTPLMMEFQITKEYLGFDTHLAYLGPMYEEVLQADTWRQGEGTLVAQTLTAMAGVSGLGSERDWQGSDFNQANWYVYGKLAWNPMLSSEGIAREWLQQTFSDDDNFLDLASDIMMRSREALVDYMTPLGLAHLMGTGHHYGPAPWVDSLSRPEWNPYYYHRADINGIGVDRTPTGTDALWQYAPEVADSFSDPASIDEKFLLWFHHLPWDYKLQSGLSLWEAIIEHYDNGLAEVDSMLSSWEELAPYVDEERFNKTRSFLQIQVDEAQWWRDACLAYFMDVSGLPLPAGSRAPEHGLAYYQALTFPNAP